jgi:3-hydroxybutyryl-CoA dehydrogenase
VGDSDAVSGSLTLGVIGGGLMGSGIAQVAARAGLATIVREVDDARCDQARTSITRSLDKGIERARLTAEQRDAALSRVTFTTDLGAMVACDVVIEAIVEDLTLKNALWRELDAICPPRTIFASNTSSLTIAAMAAASGRGDRLVGMHFFNPVPSMPLVEIVRTVTTSDETEARAFELARRLEKTPIAARDASGFVVNLLLIPYLLDAIRALEHGVASVEDIDAGMRLGTGHPMGPFTLLDFVGLDTTYRVAEIMFDEYRESRYAPPPLLKRMVLAGYLGRKSGRGFYDYAASPPTVSALGMR